MQTLEERVRNLESQVVKLLGILDGKNHVESSIGLITRNVLDNPEKGEPCFGCDYHYINGLQGRCNPLDGQCIIEEMMEADKT